MMNTVNRAVLLLRPKEPLKTWVRGLFPDMQGNDDSKVWATRVYLVDHDPKCRAESAPLRRYYREILHSELESWIEDERLWPDRRDMKLFREWFEVEATSLVVDMLDDEIVVRNDIASAFSWLSTESRAAS
jgi:hypothetical protein